MSVRLSLAAALAAGLAAASCASTDTDMLAEEPGYQAGYGDGCTTATEEDKSFSRKRARDDYMFDNDRAYRAGWRQGYLQCGSQNISRNDGGRLLGRQDEY